MLEAGVCSHLHNRTAQAVSLCVLQLLCQSLTLLILAFTSVSLPCEHHFASAVKEVKRIKGEKESPVAVIMNTSLLRKKSKTGHVDNKRGAVFGDTKIA